MISIVTLTYNNYDELIKTLYSIPDSPLIESVVVNGGNCEKTKKYLETYSGKSVSEKDDGISDAFNKGVRLSSGSYIMFLNSGDVLLSKNYIEKAIRNFESDPHLSFVHSNIIFSDQSGTELFIKPQMKSLGRGMPYNHPTMIIKKEVFDKIGEFKKELKYAMDLDLIVRMEKQNLRGFYVNDEAVVKMDGSGISVNQEIDSIRECYKILKDENYLTLSNFIGFYIRYTLYVFRKIIQILGGKKALKKLKQIKYNN